MAIPHRGSWFWEKFEPGSREAGVQLAALRRGLGREPGSVPELWPYHRVIVPDKVAARGELWPGLAAEHAALTLFGIHQQSQKEPMHKPDTPLGTALRALREHEKNSAAAVDRRVNAMATATGVTELISHLRGLVIRLRSIEQPLDYTQLVEDIHAWHEPSRRARVRRRWGIQYYGWTAQPEADQAADQDPANTVSVEA